MSAIEVAILMAVEAHSGQKDKAGAPYILHPLRLMMQFAGDADLQVVALLHDVVEDGPVTLQEIEDVFGPRIRHAIDALSRREGEDYGVFIDRLWHNPMARAVKVADLRDNMDVTRGIALDEKAVARLRKYQAALARLQS